MTRGRARRLAHRPEPVDASQRQGRSLAAKTAPIDVAVDAADLRALLRSTPGPCRRAAADRSRPPESSTLPAARASSPSGRITRDRARARSAGAARRSRHERRSPIALAVEKALTVGRVRAPGEGTASRLGGYHRLGKPLDLRTSPSAARSTPAASRSSCPTSASRASSSSTCGRRDPRSAGALRHGARSRTAGTGSGPVADRSTRSTGRRHVRRRAGGDRGARARSAGETSTPRGSFARQGWHSPTSA